MCFSLYFRGEMGGVNSPLGVKQNCPSPNASDSQITPKGSERVNVQLFVSSSSVCTEGFSWIVRTHAQSFTFLFSTQGCKEKSPSVQGDSSITSLPISIPLSTVHPSKLPVSIPLASVVLPSRAERLVSLLNIVIIKRVDAIIHSIIKNYTLIDLEFSVIENRKCYDRWYRPPNFCSSVFVVLLPLDNLVHCCIQITIHWIEWLTAVDTSQLV